ncbi:hypothetical protein H1Q78_01710 [Cellulosimicrobium cellulans]|uniref:YqeB family protein n=1 Tax=Cellulosimicrobium cellulans TaxID=1710 RepID=UPI001EDAF112|nr:hypothetical protein [Cellulosimicrobium cellulans]UKJ64215.1 hypothetical protein H1Q78_01710 [Cellulosimicrobium cellulans]
MPDTVPSPDPQPSTDLGPTRLDRAVLWGGAPVLGALVAYGLLRLAGWMTTLPWAPFQGPARLVDDLLGERGLLGAVICGVVGALVGAAFASHAVRDIAVVTVARGSATLVLRDERIELDRDRVAAVLVDRKDLVVLGRRDDADDAPVVELAHLRTELATDRLESAFRAQGWPWCDADPSAGEFRRWVAGDPALPTSADAVLRARAAMLDAGKTADVAALRRELARLDVVVRDVDKVQHWRPATTPPG